MTQEAIHDRARQAWRLRHLEGWSQRQVALHLGVDQSTISRQLKALEAELSEEFREEAEGYRARQTLQLEHLLQRTLHAFEQTCGETQKLKVTSGRWIRGRNGELLELPDLQVREELPARPNAQLVGQAPALLADLRRLWDLEPRRALAPTSTASTASTPPSPPDDIVIQVVVPDDQPLREDQVFPGGGRIVYVHARDLHLAVTAPASPATPGDGPVPSAAPETTPVTPPADASPCGSDASPRIADASSLPPAPTPAPPPAPSPVMHASPTADAYPPPISGSPSLPGKGPGVRSPEAHSSPHSHTPPPNLPTPGTEEYALLPPHYRR